MAGLQRPAVSFGRQGSSGLVWDHKFLSGESNHVANNQKQDQEQEQVTEVQQKLYIKQEKEPISSSTRPISTIVRRRSNVGQRGYRTQNVFPVIEPPSPKVIACGFCSAFVEEKQTKNHRRKRAGKGEIEQALNKTVLDDSQSAEFLLHKGLFDPIVPQTVIERPCELTVGLERTFNKAWSLLMEKEVRIVGISGLEGVGKTTLLTQIKNKFLILPNDYYLVIWVAVARRLGLQKIQEEIGNAIGFSGEQWNNKSLDAKAEDIFFVLSKRKFVLLFDDLWETVDLDKVGVPFDLMRNGSKIAFTATSENLCRHMGADKTVALKILSQKYAFELFKKKIGEEMIDSNPTIFRLAHLVVGKCNCLPLALISAAHSMSCERNPHEWYHALEILVLDKVKSIELFARSVPGSWANVLSILKFGYDNLTCIAQSCLLYCSLFPEKFKILKDDLIDYWIFEELLHGHNSRASTQKLGLDIIDELVNANFLERENQHVKMHSLVRCVALQIANMSKEKFFVQAGAHLTEVPRLAILKSNQRISLMENSIRNLSEVLECPDLLTFFLSHNPLTRISDDFFRFMDRIKVLDLSNSSIEELPSGIPKLVSLQYLNLSYTCIEKLPYELKMLSNLKYLNLEYNDLLRVIPRQVLSSLSSLRVLRMFRCGFSLMEEEDNILSDSNMHVNELQHLKHLNVLSITVKLASALEGLSSTHRLTSCTKALSLECLWGTKSLDISLLASMEHLDTLEIHRTDHLEELNIDFMMEGADIQDLGSLCDSQILRKRSFNSLQEVCVGKCLHLRDLTWLILAPNLALLKVTVCGDMEEIISIGQLGRSLNGGENLIPFAKLKVLVLESLPKLKSIYRNALPFPSLNKIRIFHCPLLKKLPLNSSSARGNAVAIIAEDHWWEDVEWENEAAKTTFSQRFIHIPD